MKNKVWFRVAASWRIMFASIAVVTFLAPGDVKAQVPSCIELSNPTIGATCYTEVTYNARVENSKAAQTFSIPQSALPGYVIVDTRDLQESRIGTTNGPSVIVTRPGTAINIRQAWQQQYRDFTDFYQRTEAEVRIRGINFGGMSDIRQRTEEQFNNAINQLTQIQSNSEAIVINGSAQAQWRTWLGSTEYTSGGTLRGRIRVFQRYVGTVDRPNQISSNARNQILALVQNADPSNPNPSSQARNVGLRGIVHLQNIGDVPFQGGTFGGRRGESRRLEGFSIAITDGTPNLGIQYMAHVQNIGDTTWVNGGQFIGTRGESRRLEGFAIRLTGSEAANYNIRYFCHLEGIGDTPVRSNGEFCGTRGESKRLEGLQVWIERKQ